jgi:hypothetical protein
MPRKDFRPEDVIAKLREADVLLGQGKKATGVVRVIAAPRRCGRIPPGRMEPTSNQKHLPRSVPQSRRAKLATMTS